MTGYTSLQCDFALIPLTPFCRPPLRGWETGEATATALIFAPLPVPKARSGEGLGVRSKGDSTLIEMLLSSSDYPAR